MQLIQPKKNERINERRLAYNLETLEHYRKKVLYSSQFRDLKFAFGNNIETMDSEAAAVYLKGFSKVE